MKKRLFYHIAFWTVYVLFKTYLNFESGTYAQKDESPISFFLTSAMAQLALLIIKIPLVYTLFYIAGRYLSKQLDIIRTISFSFLAFAACIVGFILVNHFIIVQSIYGLHTSLGAAFRFGSILYTFFILCFPSGIALAIKLVRSNIKQREIEQEIIKKKLETELQFLKAQTNPHFLFNTLNNIYALARKKSDKTADVVMKLSKLLRFMLYESQKQYISIREEVQVLDDYIELEKIRYDEKLKLSFTRSIDNDMQLIAPLILLPFVENAFKHGASESRFGSYINIDLKLQDSQLYFNIENSKTEDLVNIKKENIGLNNIRRQLELLYPNHILEIESGNSMFSVTLKVNLGKYEAV